MSIYGLSDGSFDGEGVCNGDGEMIFATRVCVWKRSVWWLKEGFEERFWWFFGGFLEEKWLDFDGFHGGNCGWEYLYYIDYLHFMWNVDCCFLTTDNLTIVF